MKKTKTMDEACNQPPGTFKLMLKRKEAFLKAEAVRAKLRRRGIIPTKKDYTDEEWAWLA